MNCRIVRTLKRGGGRSRPFAICCSALGLCILSGGCAGGEKTDDAAAQAGVFRSDPQRVRGMLLQDENGLEVRQLVLSDAPDVIAQAMATWTDQTQSGAVDNDVLERLRRNGFRLVRVPLAELDGLVSELGGASMDVSAWHGQVLEWRGLHSLPLGEGGRTMAVDGRVRNYRGGELTLMARGWVVPMEHGPRVQLELVPVHVRGESQYHRLLGQSRVDAEPLASLTTHLLLEPGFAYILTCECPLASWTVDDDEGVAHSPDTGEKASQASAGPTGTHGPVAQPPTTLGQLMLASHAGPPSRGMLIFTPRIAPELLPPDEPVALAGPGARERRR